MAFYAWGGGWQLSPLFDVNPNPFTSEQRVLPLFGEQGDKEVEGLRQCGAFFGIDKPTQMGCVARVCEAFRHWKRGARRLGCPNREIALFEPIIAERL